MKSQTDSKTNVVSTVAAPEIIRPIWPVPARVVAGVTTRTGGVSASPYADFNLAQHVDDLPDAVAHNRQQLIAIEQPGSAWQWLNQTHSTDVIEITGAADHALDADGLITDSANLVCAVLTADCLPILLADVDGSRVGAVHAGWRGLQNGIIDKAIALFCRQRSGRAVIAANQVCVWLGPAIGPNRFEVGAEVKAGFNADYHSAFRQHAQQHSHQHGKVRYIADIYQLATIALANCGVHAIYGGGFCTHSDERRFFSYRRDGITGRMASYIYIDSTL